MSGFLIDTNVISEMVRPAPDANVKAWSELQAKPSLFLSVVSMGELHKGLTIMPQGARRKPLGHSVSNKP
jgi:predicted nucleic acid-binding protein